MANKTPKAPLLLAPESDYTNKADQIGVSEESKIGESDFDKRYVIRDPDGKAGTVLTSDVISAVEALEPFVELELTRKHYRLLKEGHGRAAGTQRYKGALRKVVCLDQS